MAREGLEVADVFRHFGPAFRDRHDASLSTARRRAMSAIEHCRTAALGGHVERCGECGHQRIAYNSCRNRNCPKCQGLARAQWLEDRQAELLDVPYFHVVFTVPEQIATIAFQNQTVVYDILFRAVSETLRTIAADPKHLGAEIGVLAVLHTWGQNLMHHPHLHCLVPGGGIAPDGESWIACRPGFFLPVRVLSRLFRGLFLHYLEKAFTAGELNFFSAHRHLHEPAAFRRYLAPLYQAEWVVYARPFAGPQVPLLYPPSPPTPTLSIMRHDRVVSGIRRFTGQSTEGLHRQNAINRTEDRCRRSCQRAKNAPCPAFAGGPPPALGSASAGAESPPRATRERESLI